MRADTAGRLQLQDVAGEKCDVRHDMWRRMIALFCHAPGGDTSERIAVVPEAPGLCDSFSTALIGTFRPQLLPGLRIPDMDNRPGVMGAHRIAHRIDAAAFGHQAGAWSQIIAFRIHNRDRIQPGQGQTSRQSKTSQQHSQYPHIDIFAQHDSFSLVVFKNKLLPFPV